MLITLGALCDFSCMWILIVEEAEINKGRKNAHKMEHIAYYARCTSYAARQL